ncbi:MAG: DinB family protein [Edaphobacter sp.]|uniref:DinB family protein n=1 Tax=Edaphobacter sp. TaxID=1934404 RepID=UPI002394741D|nr:DinB family protein [Edaphobacter sp.]MDE1178017.1 DinB family protein [Edaphobacter sp.]
MKMKDLFLEELRREEAGTRKALERVPEGQNDWAPHEKSMQMGYLASLVATMPAWIDMMINQDELDFAPVDPAKQRKPLEWTKTSELIDLFDQNMKRGIAALESTTDEHLMTNWKLLAAGHLISDEPRYVNIMNGMLMHWAHHRGQLTVYLRLREQAVPAIYGPSADEKLAF